MKIETVTKLLAILSLIACSLLVRSVVQLNKTVDVLENRNKTIHANIRESLAETVVTFSKDGELTMQKIPVGSSLHVITSGEKLIRVEVEPDRIAPEDDPKYASLFKK